MIIYKHSARSYVTVLPCSPGYHKIASSRYCNLVQPLKASEITVRGQVRELLSSPTSARALVGENRG